MQSRFVTANSLAYINVPCPAGKVTGGGHYGADASTYVVNSWPNTATSWEVYVDTGATADTIFAYAICMTTEPSAVSARLSPAARRAGQRRRQ